MRVATAIALGAAVVRAKLLADQEDQEIECLVATIIETQTSANGGQLPELPCVYKSTHFNDATKQWISLKCEKNYDNMIKIQAEHYSQPSIVPITSEELSVKVLKRRSGYVKGLGLRPSFSVKTTSASTNSDYVRHLEMEIQEQKDKIQSQKGEITSQKHEIQARKKRN
ncbi:uncharacterized protein LOC114256656 [Camellia sinensis]|uniref:uncharacterized protein LOC114256656 n=1 Tax=Camellia sinensis TaxID=4442 RepID=UPI0010364E97|nr:uncharacterized protein LOC114256656 [Camellia sinensis]